jgi:hypothetical protein
MRRPYENENPMHVMGRDRKPVQEKPGKMGLQVPPAFVCHLAERGKDHPCVHALAQ